MAIEPYRTLVVEDEPTTRHLIEEVLRGRGHEVEACADAESAWQLAEREHFSLALLDMRLPGMDGVALCRKLRLLPRSDEMVVVFITAADSVHDLGRALEAGADDYILKPVGEANLPLRLALAERRIHFLQDRKRTEEGLVRDALHDRVTDLVNRTLFSERLQRISRRASRENQKPGRQGKYLYAVLYLNIDNFGQLNARFGYQAGDDALRQVGHRLEECVRGGDTVARFGGDEFVFLLDDMNDVSDPTRVFRRIEQAFEKPLVLGTEKIRITATVGISLSIGEPKDPSNLVEEARLALIKAKEQGPGSHQIHDVVVHARAMARLQLESRLRRAIENGEMMLLYQPIVSAEAGRLAGVEALVRWRDPLRELVGPEEFIDVAEDTGAIIPLGAWIIGEAVAQLGEWNATLPADQQLFMSINVSGRQFTDPDMAECLAAAIKDARVVQGSVHVEITETALMTNLETASGTLSRLRDLGVKIFVDDFGTGYSSLSYLCRLPLDGLKIDRSFVMHATDSHENLEVVRTIAQLANTLNLVSIAEGVETDRQVKELQALGVEYMQGFLFGRPMTATVLEARLRADSDDHPVPGTEVPSLSDSGTSDKLH